MKKLSLVCAFFMIPSAYGMTTEDSYDITQQNELLKEWNIDPNTFFPQEGCSSRIMIFEKGDHDDTPIGVATIAIKKPSIFTAFCGAKEKAYIEVLAANPTLSQEEITQKMINVILQTFKHTPEIDQVNALIRRDDTATEKLYKGTGFTEEQTPDWAPKKFTYHFIKR